jgi:DNA-binding transcriptional LysR family regulator
MVTRPKDGATASGRRSCCLSSEPVLRLAGESRGRALLDEYLSDQRIRPVSTIDVPRVSLLLSYVSGGLGIGLVPALALAEAPSDRVVREPAKMPALPVTLVWRAVARVGAKLKKN